MGREKVKLELITNEKKRNTTYQNRKESIFKKAQELSVLCDVDTAVIVYPPGSNEPEIWPQDPDHIKNMIRSYKEEKNDNRKRTYGLEDYFQDRKRKVEEELVRARERNLEAKYPTWFDDLNGLSEGELRQLAMELENKKNNAKAVLERKKRESNVQIKNNQPSSSHSMGGSLDQFQTSHDHPKWIGDKPDLQLRLGLEHENKQKKADDDNVVSLDEGGSVDGGCLGDKPDLQLRMWFKQQGVGSSSHTSTRVDQGGSSQTSHDREWLDVAPSSSSIPLKPEVGGFSYPVFEGDDDNSNSTGESGK